MAKSGQKSKGCFLSVEIHMYLWIHEYLHVHKISWRNTHKNLPQQLCLGRSDLGDKKRGRDLVYCSPFCIIWNLYYMHDYLFKVSECMHACRNGWMKESPLQMPQASLGNTSGVEGDTRGQCPTVWGWSIPIVRSYESICKFSPWSPVDAVELSPLASWTTYSSFS